MALAPWRFLWRARTLFHPARGIVGVGLDDAQAGTAAAAAQRDGCPRKQDAKVENLHVDAAAILAHGSDGSGGAGLDHRKS
jgi:hypothetical protein